MAEVQALALAGAKVCPGDPFGSPPPREARGRSRGGGAPLVIRRAAHHAQGLDEIALEEEVIGVEGHDHAGAVGLDDGHPLLGDLAVALDHDREDLGLDVREVLEELGVEAADGLLAVAD